MVESLFTSPCICYSLRLPNGSLSPLTPPPPAPRPYLDFSFPVPKNFLTRFEFPRLKPSSTGFKEHYREWDLFRNSSPLNINVQVVSVPPNLLHIYVYVCVKKGPLTNCEPVTYLSDRSITFTISPTPQHTYTLLYDDEPTRNRRTE